MKNLTILQMRLTAQSLLGKAEKEYLKRDTNYEFLGVVVHEKGPLLDLSIPRKATIWVSKTAETRPLQCIHQIAHEVIHLLAPRQFPPDEPQATMLEEGLATYFSIYGPDFPKKYVEESEIHFETKPEASNWREALALYNELIAIEPDAIRILRAVKPSFHDMTVDSIRKAIQEVPEELAVRLIERRIMPIKSIS
jgi:hypothetical protein